MTDGVKVEGLGATDRIVVLFGAPCATLLAFGLCWLILVNYPRSKPRSGNLPALLE
jgi:hypothetical protein